MNNISHTAIDIDDSSESMFDRSSEDDGFRRVRRGAYRHDVMRIAQSHSSRLMFLSNETFRVDYKSIFSFLCSLEAGITRVCLDFSSFQNHNGASQHVCEAGFIVVIVAFSSTIIWKNNRLILLDSRKSTISMIELVIRPMLIPKLS